MRDWDESITGIQSFNFFFLVIVKDMENRLEKDSGCCSLSFNNTPPNSKTLTTYK